MINLSISTFNIFENIDILNNYLLIIQNKKELYKFLKDIGNGCIYDELIQVYDENNRKLKNSDYIDFVPSILSIDINNKRNINALIRIIKKSQEEPLKNSINVLNKYLKDLFNNIRLEIPFTIIDNIELEEDDIIKLMDIKIEDNDQNLLERINTYIQTSFELRNIKIFVFYGLFSLLEDQEVDSLIKNCKYYGIIIVDIENIDIQTSIDFNKLILDQDICLLK